MTTVTSLTADRMLAIEAASVVDGDVIGGNLILTKHDGSQINAGNVTGPTGSPGPVGQDLSILSSIPILDVGVSGQIRAGRQLTAADFTNMGLSAPLGLWNLSDLTDVSGNGRNLLNKGAVPFATGINGVANTAAQFVGSTAQALYISDTGTADPFRILTGSIGCWFRTAKRNTTQAVISKFGAVAGQSAYTMQIAGNNTLIFYISSTGSDLFQAASLSDPCDDRWHFAVGTVDTTNIRLYIDGIVESLVVGPGMVIAPVGPPFNIGGQAADGGNPSTTSNFGYIDEAFVTGDVLSEDQIRNLYSIRIPHTLGVVPSRVSLNIKRRRKGAVLTVADFSKQPLRLYNFSGGSLGDEGSNGITLTPNGNPLSMPGVDGSVKNAFYFNGAQSLSGTDAGLPAGLAVRSYGAWFKSSYVGGSLYQAIIGWGTSTNVNQSVLVIDGAGNLVSVSGSDNFTTYFVADGKWHFVVQVDYNAAGPLTDDGIKRKLYIDGQLAGISTVMVATVLGGASHFRIGSSPNNDTYLVGQVDGAFVCDYVLSVSDIARLYAKGSQRLITSPKNVGDHVEGMDTNSVFATFDTLESQHMVDMTVAP